MSTSRLVANQEGSSSSTKMKKILDSWKFPKIPIDQVYKKKTFPLFPSYAIKDFEETITFKSSNEDVTCRLLTKTYMDGFVTKQHEFLHLGLVQIAIKSLMRDGLEAPITVCLRDGRHRDFNNSLLAIVETDLSKGPFYFNCFPSFSVSSKDATTSKALTLQVKSGGVPLALTYRIVCKATVNLSSKALELGPTLGETSYFHMNLGSSNKYMTKWDDVKVPEGWIHPEEPQAPRKTSSFNSTVKLPDGRVLLRFPSARDASE